MTTEQNETTPLEANAAPERLEPVSPSPEPEQPATETAPAQPEQPATEPPTAQPEKPKMGRFQRILRTALIGLAAVIVVFLAGFLTDHFVRYSPMKAELTQSQDELSQANQDISDLQSQINNLNDQLAINENLQTELDSANQHIELLQALVELRTARIELGNDNIAGAKVALLNTFSRMENLKPLVETVDATLAANMFSRLDLILTGIDSDPVTAQTDLDLLAENLLSVETLLFP